jgi:hypothetical protein
MRGVVYFAYLFMSSMLISEVALRSMGYKPGVFQAFDGFQPVDSLYEYRNYTTDDYGAYKFSSWVSDSVLKYYEPPGQFPLSGSFSEHIANKAISERINWEADHVNQVFIDYANLWHDLSSDRVTPVLSPEDSARYRGSLPCHVRKLLSKSDTAMTTLDSLTVRYVYSPFNSDGFRSIEFVQFDNDLPRILLVGDSFTYGESARPIYNSFADILLAEGYGVYNAGISGTDPAQYMAIVQKYVQELRPDIVVIAFYSSNDMMRNYRDPAPDRPHEYITNAGFYYSHSTGEHLTLEEGYALYEKLCLIPQSNAFNRLCSQMAVSTHIWRVLHRLGIVSHPLLEQLLEGWSGESVHAVKVTSKYLDGIQHVCQQNNTPFVLAVIPDVSRQDDARLDSPCALNDPKVDSLIEKYPHAYPATFIRSDFADGGDIHFNNQGSVKFAGFLKELINERVGNTVKTTKDSD